MLISRTKTTIDTIIPISFSTKALIKDGLRNPSSVSWAPECFADCLFRSSSWKGTSMIFVPGIFSGRWTVFFWLKFRKFFLGGEKGEVSWFLSPADLTGKVLFQHPTFAWKFLHTSERPSSNQNLHGCLFYQQKITGQKIFSRLGVVWHVWPHNPIYAPQNIVWRTGLTNFWSEYGR